jgi:hypothetical protein
MAAPGVWGVNQITVAAYEGLCSTRFGVFGSR